MIQQELLQSANQKGSDTVWLRTRRSRVRVPPGAPLLPIKTRVLRFSRRCVFASFSQVLVSFLLTISPAWPSCRDKGPKFCKTFYSPDRRAALHAYTRELRNSFFSQMLEDKVVKQWVNTNETGLRRCGNSDAIPEQDQPNRRLTNV